MDLSLELTKIMTFEILINQNTFPARVICAVLLGSCYLASELLRSRTHIFKRILRNENKQCIRIFKNIMMVEVPIHNQMRSPSPI